MNVFWFRRDLRLEDNVALYKATLEKEPVIPLFIFDIDIIDSLPKDDARITFIFNTLKKIDTELKKVNSSVLIKIGKPIEIWKELISEYKIDKVFYNKDYEPYAISRDLEVAQFLNSKNIGVFSYKDQVVFEESEVVKADGLPYTVFTPYKNKWLSKFNDISLSENNPKSNFYNFKTVFPSLESIGFVESKIKVKRYNLAHLDQYDAIRDFPFVDKTSYVSPYLRFGLVSARKLIKIALKSNATYLSELIWREFFMQILFHFPKVVTQNFKSKYNQIEWRNNEQEFEAWCKGETGYPMVDAGMRQLNQTGYMHNRVRMVTAGFLCKHLLIDWRLGEAYFAEKLVDYDLSANNGNWQWAAGTGCDSAPYFRIFNPTEQLKKFDKNLEYTNTWVKDLNEFTYPQPIVEHKFARERALFTYKKGLNL
ncbi:Deoxyribodipyrimidine photo-lyase [Polaribacter huanghezhanensis]|uniref:cryptochrome/photolyase family protein n=1 Tax=Polaribacter huanghezhanensis TaxID=1354726 RepID=UPI0026490146|nr:deoxyribodipyrimidine photo-lyase [Polaribacter huanghezhanensis]WKD86819.1 Deoxyribodipyrimidine photo-lyase [Polaribacter huanghezhanensis]